MSNYDYIAFPPLPRWTGKLIPHNAKCRNRKGVWSRKRNGSWISRFYQKSHTCPGCDQRLVEDAFLAIKLQAREDGDTMVFLWPLCAAEAELKTTRESLTQQRKRASGSYAVLRDPKKEVFYALTTWDQRGGSPQELASLLGQLMLDGWRVESSCQSWGRAAYNRKDVSDPAKKHGTLYMDSEQYIREFKKVGITVYGGRYEWADLEPDPTWEQEVQRWQERYPDLSQAELVDALPDSKEQLVDGLVLDIADKVREAYRSTERLPTARDVTKSPI